uniref:Uncharacterized protein n=1 Tax=Meloidogyne hapla TaxID=6305 RepID=A0A1I8BVQ4_MELHA
MDNFNKIYEKILELNKSKRHIGKINFIYDCKINGNHRENDGNFKENEEIEKEVANIKKEIEKILNENNENDQKIKDNETIKNNLNKINRILNRNKHYKQNYFEEKQKELEEIRSEMFLGSIEHLADMKKITDNYDPINGIVLSAARQISRRAINSFKISTESG